MYRLIVVVSLVLIACSDDGRMSREAYGDAATNGVMYPIIDALDELATLSRAASHRPALFRNEAWQDDVLTQTDAIHAAHQRAQALTPPEGHDSTQVALERATECFADGADDVERAIAEESVVLFERSASMMASCHDLLRDVTLTLR